MQALKKFSLPLKGMEIGFHNFPYQITEDFFNEFENSMVSKGDIAVDLKVEKKSDHLVLDITIDGTVHVECDRCTDNIDYPINTDERILVKYDINEREEEDIVYIDPESSEFNCSKVIYDIVILSMPMFKSCDEVEHKVCNEDFIRFLNKEEENTSSEEENIKNPLSEALKNLKLN